MPSRADIIAAARNWCGTPFHHRAALRGIGCDCIGLILGLYRDLYGRAAEPVPAYAADWGELAFGEPLLDGLARHLEPVGPERARPGDVLAFRWLPGRAIAHVAVLTAPGRMIHAHRRHGVREVALVPAFSRRLEHAFAFPGTED
ncbi:MAG TPA: NlpC/P60 family protein [Hyphomicrobiales bacterium]|mgnify:CR=1 FL=1|nr:C40 family peptidase [Rhodobiaceae bacterium]HXK54908.1 NlpC/P60 family protein [Hyphomicrobiales bacterium]